MNVLETWPKVIMNTYGTPTIELVSGSGVYVTDSLGRSHIDMSAGIGLTV